MAESKSRLAESLVITCKRTLDRDVGVVATRVLQYLIVTLFAGILLLPAAWLISTSLKIPGAEMTFPPELIPKQISWSNYPVALTTQPFHLFFRNTLLIVILNLIGVLLTGSMAGYSFARLRFRLRGVLFSLCLSTMMLPYVVTLVPTFILFRVIGWTNTFLPLTVPAFFGGSAFSIFLFRQFFLTLPFELDEAARVDGASSLQIWWRIILPLSGPVLATVGIFSVVFNWNEFMGPLIFLNTPDRFTLALGLRMFQMSMGTYGVGQWALLMAASTSMIVPILILFFVAQRYFISGIVMSGLAGR